MRLLVIGAGGHAKVVVEAAESAGFEVAGVIGLPTDPSEVLGHAVSLSDDGIEAHGFIVAIGNNRTRAEYFGRYRERGLEPLSVIHPSAIVSPTARIGAGTLVMPGVIVNAQADVGSDAILNTGCVVEHDVAIGDHALIGPLACLCGAAGVGPGVLLGAGTTVAPGTRVGEWSTCGAGAAVVSDLPAHALCVGVPARVSRMLGGAE